MPRGRMASIYRRTLKMQNAPQPSMSPNQTVEGIFQVPQPRLGHKTALMARCGSSSGWSKGWQWAEIVASNDHKSTKPSGDVRPKPVMFISLFVFKFWSIHPSKVLNNSCIISVGTADSKQGLVTNLCYPRAIKTASWWMGKGHMYLITKMTFPTDICVRLPVQFHQYTATSQLFLKCGDKDKTVFTRPQ